MSEIGEPDGLERLWTPHRMTYLKGDGRTDEQGCPFDPEASTLFSSAGASV